MSAFSASNLVAAQTTLVEQFTKPEMREKVLPSLQLGLSNKDITIKSVNEMRLREERPVYGYAMKRQVRTPGSQRTYNHTGSYGDSMQLPFTWVTYADTFAISLKELDTNVFDFNKAMAQNMKNCILNIHSAIESDSIANLLTNKTQVVKSTASTPAPGIITWNPTNYTYEIAAGYDKQFTQYAKVAMMANYYNDPTFDAIYSLPVHASSSFWQSQGAGNYQNTAFQFTGMEIAPSIELTDSNYTNGVALVMPKGTYSLLPWIPKQNRMGYGDYNTYNGGFGSFVDPITNPGGIYSGGLEFAVHGYALRADQSTYNSVNQDLQMQFEISVDVAFAITPFSTANESVVYEFAQL